MQSSARNIARAVLAQLRAEDVLASEALHTAFTRHGQVSPQERALATELVYGVSRHQRFLRHVLAQYTDLGKTKAVVVDALLLAAYQLIFLARVPGFAAVDEAVAMVAARQGRTVAGFANAVLRKVSASADQWASARSELPPAVAYSLPDWLAREMETVAGAAYAEAAAAYAEPARLALRVHTGRIGVEDAYRRLVEGSGEYDMAARLEPAVPGAITVERLGNVREHPLFVEGLVTVQDLAAQVCGHLMAPAEGERLIDMCAGVGGKATHLAALAPGARIEAFDMSGAKLVRLSQARSRLGADNITTTQRDWLAPPSLEEAPPSPCDGVLLDAPCSGLGIMRRHPEIKWRRSQGDITRNVAISRRLLDIAASLVRPGGRLVFAVCTWTAQEGPEQLAGFLARHPEFALTSREELAARHGPALAAMLADDGTLATWPHRQGCDGFFAAHLRRKR